MKRSKFDEVLDRLLIVEAVLLLPIVAAMAIVAAIVVWQDMFF